MAEEEVADDDAAAKLKIPAYKPSHIKIKIDLNINIGCPKLKLYDRPNGSRDEVIVKKFDDITEHMRFLTKNKLIIHMSRLYSTKNKSGSDKRRYGIRLKLVATERTNKPEKA